MALVINCINKFGEPIEKRCGCFKYAQKLGCYLTDSGYKNIELDLVPDDRAPKCRPGFLAMTFDVPDMVFKRNVPHFVPLEKNGIDVYYLCKSVPCEKCSWYKEGSYDDIGSYEYCTYHEKLVQHIDDCPMSCEKWEEEPEGQDDSLY